MDYIAREYYSCHRLNQIGRWSYIYPASSIQEKIPSSQGIQAAMYFIPVVQNKARIQTVVRGRGPADVGGAGAAETVGGAADAMDAEPGGHRGRGVGADVGAMASAMSHMFHPDRRRRRGHAPDHRMPAARGRDHQSPRGEDVPGDEGRTQVRPVFMLFPMRGAAGHMSTVRGKPAWGMAAGGRDQVSVPRSGDPHGGQYHAFGSGRMFRAGVSVHGGRWGRPGPGRAGIYVVWAEGPMGRDRGNTVGAGVLPVESVCRGTRTAMFPVTRWTK
jgi:hypothetical protein